MADINQSTMTISKKPTLILLHGALGTEKQMDKIADKFKAQYRVLSFTFKGHGGDTSHESFSIAAFVGQLKEFIKANQLTTFSIFGYSMGGYVALKYAMKAADGIQEIFTFGTKFNWTTAYAEREVQKLNPMVLEMKVPHFADLLKQTHGEQAWKGVLKNTADLMLGLGAGKSFLEEDFSNITCLVHVGVGDLDDTVGVDESKQVAETLQNGRLKVLRGAKHPVSSLNDGHLEELVARD